MSAIVILLLLGVLSANAQDPCFASITATARAGALWESQFTWYQVFDILRSLNVALFFVFVIMYLIT